MFHNLDGASAARLAEPAASSGGGLATTRDEIQFKVVASQIRFSELTSLKAKAKAKVA